MEFDDYDVDDIYFDEEDAERSRSAQDKKSKNKRNQEDAGLGIDEEISVAKRQRAPRVKLDEVRLLSEKGIPELRRRASKLKFKGKGHEFSDAVKLLDFYQFWLDDLFPKAKFLDALGMVEKLGHKKAIRAARMNWIDEDRRKLSSEGSDEVDVDEANFGTDGENNASIFGKQESGGQCPHTPASGDDAIVRDLTPRVRDTTLEDHKGLRNDMPLPKMSGALGSMVLDRSTFGNTNAETNGPKLAEEQHQKLPPTALVSGQNEEDDLDALMAEVEADEAEKLKAQTSQFQLQKTQKLSQTDDYMEEEAIMAEMGF